MNATRNPRPFCNDNLPLHLIARHDDALAMLRSIVPAGCGARWQL